MSLSHPGVKNRSFLQPMFADDYFPKDLVEKGKEILVRLCERIEAERPIDVASVIALAHKTTEQFNHLAEEFGDRGSEIESVARDVIAGDFDFILKSYGFDVNIEDAISSREW